MLIRNRDTKETWDHVVIHLNISEARELRDCLEALIDNPNAGRHEHAPSTDYRREVIVLISDKE